MDQDQKETLLQSLAKTGNLSIACRAAGLMRREVIILRQTDPSFGEAYNEAMDNAADCLEAEAWRRALEGIAQPIIKAGRPVVDPVSGETIMQRRYSDPFLVMLLKGCKPDKYQTRGNFALSLDTSALVREISSDDDPPRSAPKLA